MSQDSSSPLAPALDRALGADHPHPAPGGGAPAVGAALRQDGPDPVRLPVLLLVPVRSDPGVPAGPHPRRRSALSAGSRTGGRSGAHGPMSAVAVSVFVFLFLARHRARLRGRPLAPGRSRQPRRVGPRRPRLRHLHRLVPHRRRPLHGVHLHRGAGDAVRRQRGRLLRRAVHDRGLPADLPVPAAALVGVPPARLRHARPTSSRAATAPSRSPSPSPSPASSRRCPTSPSSWSGSSRCCEVAGFGGSGNWFVKDLPLFIAFAVLAAYTYSSGLRAPALIAFVKDILIYVVIIVAVIYLPHAARRLGPHLRARPTTRSRPSTPRTPTRSRPARRRPRR